MEITLVLFAAIAILALLCEFMDASIGMGYGTTLTPLLLLIGFSPLDVVPAVLLGQLVGGLVGGLAHHRVGNITLDFRPDEKRTVGRLRGLSYLPRSLDAKVVVILVLCGVVGTPGGVFSALNIPGVVLKTYIGAMILAIGIILLTRRNHRSPLSWKRLVGVGLLSSFNKGISGGGYGPLVTGGQILSGRDTKNSVGATTLAESVVCIVGFSTYLLVKGDILWTLAAATSVGSIAAAPFAALTVQKINTGKLRFAIGVATIILGTLTLARVYIF